MTPELLTDCAQLTKANSIEGNKKDNITVIYTPWSNLKKDGSMAVGQVGFKDQRKASGPQNRCKCLHPAHAFYVSWSHYYTDRKQVKRIHVVQRENPIVNRLNKTKVEKFPDLREEREARRRELRKRDQTALQEKVSSL